MGTVFSLLYSWFAPSLPTLPAPSAMALETLHLEHVPESHRVYAAFFKDVTNAEFLQAQLLARNADFEYAFVDASSSANWPDLSLTSCRVVRLGAWQVLGRLQVLAAAYKAVSVFLDGTLKTSNIHSEIVCSLSSSKNISEAYRRWGITPATKDVIVIKVSETQTAEEVWAHLVENVKGRPVPLTDEEITTSTDWPKVRKYYKLNGVPALDALKSEEEKRREMTVLAMEGMALRGV